MRRHFVLVAEGSSDLALIPHLEQLCIDAGADEVTGAAPDFQRLPQRVGRTVQARIRVARILEPAANLLLVHRDADAANASPRMAEVSEAVRVCAVAGAWVAVGPVQETEAWLLLDEAAIRRVAGRPNGCAPLLLPSPNTVESIARPKERLQHVLRDASGLSGRRREQFVREFPRHRNLLLRQLLPGGQLEPVPSWVRVRDDIRQAIRALSDVE